MAQNAVAVEVHRQQTPPEIVGVRKTNSPHFMSPTIASKLSRANGPDNRATTPVSIRSVKSDRGQSLLQSAVQRVGRRRAATNDTTRGYNGSPIKHGKVISFPDKVYKWIMIIMMQLTNLAVNAFVHKRFYLSSNDSKYQG